MHATLVPYALQSPALRTEIRFDDIIGDVSFDSIDHVTTGVALLIELQNAPRLYTIPRKDENTSVIQNVFLHIRRKTWQQYMSGIRKYANNA